MSASDGVISYNTMSLVRLSVAAGLIVVSTVYRLPPVHRVLSPYLNDTLQLKDIPSDVDPKEACQRAVKWAPARSMYNAMGLLGALLVAVWAVAFGDTLVRAINSGGLEVSRNMVIYTGCTMVLWALLLLRSIAKPPLTPPYSSLAIYLLLATSSAITLLEVWYLRYAYGYYPSWAKPTTYVLEGINLVGGLMLAALAGYFRFNSPLVLGAAPSVGRDDRVRLWQWVSFSWMSSFINEWSQKEMQPEDLPRLSPTQQTAIVFAQFRQITDSALIWRVLKVNRFDILVDAVFTCSSVVLNYCGPFFLKRILQGLENPTSVSRAQAYVFTFLAFLASASKAVSDLIHLYHSRRASVRIRAELIAAVYDKALRRKETAGVVAAKEETEVLGKAATDITGKKDVKKSEDQGSADTGKVVNLMSSDTNTISSVISSMYMVYSSPIEIIVAGTFLYRYVVYNGGADLCLLGWSAFTGIVVLIFASPLNMFISNRAVKIQKDLLKARDKRMSVMNELIGAITFIKFFAWTKKWTERASEARTNELRWMIKSMLNNMAFTLLWSFVPILVTLCAFFSYIFIAKEELTISVAFTALALFNMLRMPLNAIPIFVMWILQAAVSVKRLDAFLKEPEVPDWVSSLKRKETSPSGETRLGFQNATLRWNAGKPDADDKKPEEPSLIDVDEEDNIFELGNININFPIGKLSVVSGPTGAGKTAILVALLGEMDLLSGETYLPKYSTQVDPETGLRNSVAYAAQTPWLQQMSIKDNILFGETLDEERYEAVVDACALRPDFDILEDGDSTEIGAKGVSLSGGQKARVALARAVYSYTRHVLLDDPLAAVDSHTAKHLVDKCLTGPLLKGRTIILVSHHLDLLCPVADYIVRILDGRVDCQGSTSELKRSGDLDGIVAIEEATVAKEEPAKKPESEVIEDEVEEDKKKEKKTGPARKLVKDEERAVGNVKWATYKLYIQSATLITWSLYFFVLILSQLTSIGEKLWLKVWGDHYNTELHSLFAFTTPWVHGQHADQSYADHFIYHTPKINQMPAFTVQGRNETIHLPSASEHPGFYLSVYASIALGTAFLSLLLNLFGMWGSYRAAKTLHNRLLFTIVRGTVRFFNTTPLGRIINRFSKDVETVDTRLAGSTRTTVMYIASLIFTIGMIAFIIPSFLLFACVIGFFYWHYTVLYLRTGRSLRRLEATARSPIFSGFAELLDGVVSVRAFSAEHRMFEVLCKQVDLSNSAFYYYWMTNRWLLIRFDSLGAVFVFLTSILALTGTVGAGYAAIAITSAQSFVSACYWVSRFWGELEMDMNSVERIEEYLNVPQEPPAIISSNRPPAYWPSYSTHEAFISARDVEIKYAPDLPTVFKGSFNIKPGEKIGLIGRTGSGKSTLAMALLRFTDPASGSILIDGIDITTIGVDDLRSRITYIPQDAVLFSGTIRDNLDPFGEHSDSDLIDALIRVNLMTGDTPAVSRAPSHARLAQLINESHGKSASGTSTPSHHKVHISLSSEVSAGGSNFSQGQRQLVAMARALLRRSNLIIMDEATASVDFATDEALQRAIRTEFKQSTLITIAHRLSSVIDYDRLLVLADGGVKEFDTPMNLLRRDSLFKSLAEKSGKFRELKAAAERKEKGEDASTSTDSADESS